MKRLSPDQPDRLFLRRLFLVAAMLALVALLYRIADLLILGFGAALGAVLLSAVADWIADKTGWPRAIGLTIATLLLFAVLGLIGWLFGDETARQASKLWQTLPADWAKLKTMLEASPIGHMLSSSFQQGSQGSGLAHLLLGAGWGATEFAGNFLVMLIGAIFLAAEPGLYRRGAVLLVPPAYRDVARDALDDLGRALRLWLITQIISMTMMGIMIGLGIWWSGVEAPAALGLLGGLSEFIPYVGPTLAMIPAIIMALVGHGSIWGVLATYLVVRIVQVQIITPLISRQMVSVPPALYLFLILASGYAFGVFGMFFAGALAVTTYTLVIRLYSRETLGDDVPPPGS